MLRRLSGSLGIALLTVVVGCSGAEESDLFGPGASDQGGANAPATDSPATSSDSTTPAPSKSTNDDSSASTQPPAPSKPDPGAADPKDPAQVCAVESLDNDEFKTADSFDSCIAGKLSGRDIDFVTTVAPATAKQIFIKHADTGGQVSYRVFVNGFSATFTDEPPASIPAVPNGKYTFKIEPSGFTSGDRTWQLEVTFQ